jgi:prephenate dehydrogenase
VSAPVEPRRAAVVGTGLIGGSIGLALRQRGWHVTGRDRNAAMEARALELGAFDAVGHDPDAELTFVATPVGSIAEQVAEALASTAGLVTDVGSVKAPMLGLMSDPRYVGGHPMAGSELEGVDGARAELFEGAMWVLTPVPGTDDDAYREIHAVVSSFGAEVIALPPQRHDSMVAMVSHVPHLTAATLMGLADERSVEHRALLRLAAGGFRDMTRIAAGHPGIWPDICTENRDAIVDELDGLIEALQGVREIVAEGNREALVEILDQARSARIALPSRFSRPQALVEVRVPIADRAGELARVLLLAAEVDVSIFDIEIAHSSEGPQGVLILVVEATAGDVLRSVLVDHGYAPSSLRPLE